MKITVNANIGGYAFHIDEDAYHELRDYLRSLELHFAGEEGASEIMADIESRISELFRNRLGIYRQVVNIDDVREVMTTMGGPTDFGEQASDEEKKRRPDEKGRRMYRDPEGRMIGGVCSGMAAFWQIDPFILRIIFLVLLLAGGLSIFLYVILWIVLPEARTTAEKIEMRGEPVNIDNITESVKKEFDRMKKNFKKSRS